MEEQKYPAKYILVFIRVFNELVENGFKHGCDPNRRDDSITIKVSLYEIGASAEIINNNKSKIIPDLESIKLTKSTGHTGRGLRTARLMADKVSLTHNGRGIKFLISKNFYADYPVYDGITIVKVGAFSDEVVEIVNRTLDGMSGDVIVVLGPGMSGSKGSTTADAVEKNIFVGKFAIVAEEDMRDAVLDEQEHLPKLVGCYGSFEEARVALHPKPVRGKGSADYPTRIMRNSRTRDRRKSTQEKPRAEIEHPNQDTTESAPAKARGRRFVRDIPHIPDDDSEDDLVSELRKLESKRKV